MEPLLDKQRDRCGCEAEYEAREPESVEPNRGFWRLKRRLNRIRETALEGSIYVRRRYRKATQLGGDSLEYSEGWIRWGSL